MGNNNDKASGTEDDGGFGYDLPKEFNYLSSSQRRQFNKDNNIKSYKDEKKFYEETWGGNGTAESRERNTKICKDHNDNKDKPKNDK